MFAVPSITYLPTPHQYFDLFSSLKLHHIPELWRLTHISKWKHKEKRREIRAKDWNYVKSEELQEVEVLLSMRLKARTSAPSLTFVGLAAKWECHTLGRSGRHCVNWPVVKLRAMWEIKQLGSLCWLEYLHRYVTVRCVTFTLMSTPATLTRSREFQRLLSFKNFLGIQRMWWKTYPYNEHLKFERKKPHNAEGTLQHRMSFAHK